MLIWKLAKQIIIRGYLLLKSLDLLSYKWITSYSQKVENLISERERGWGRGEGDPNKSNGGRVGNFFEKTEVGGTLIRDSRVVKSYGVKCEIL